MYLYGASGHGKVIAEIAEENNVVVDAFIDQNVLKTEFLEYKVLHGIPDINADFIISIGNNFYSKKDCRFKFYSEFYEIISSEINYF